MKKSIIVKIILLIITFALVACAFTNVYAADEVPSLSDKLPGEDEDIPDLTFPQQTPETPVEPETPTTTDKPSTPGSSSYEQSEIPYAGAETSILIVAAFVVCGIVGIYTFTKLSDYSNI